MVYQWYISGIPVEISGKIWWYYHWHTSGISMYTSGISVVYQRRRVESTILPLVIPEMVYMGQWFYIKDSHISYCM